MLTKIRYMVVADTETGGLPDKNKKAFTDVALCELAAVVIDCTTLQIIHEASWIVKPYKEGLEYSERAQEVHGLSKQHLMDNGVDIKTVFKEFKAILTKYKNPHIGAVLCGHNFQQFDIPFVEGMFTFNGDDLWDSVKFVEDTMKLGWYRSLEQENYKLVTCCRNEGVSLVDAHHALTDTKANAELMIKYLLCFRGESSSVNNSNEMETRFRDKFQLV